MAINLTVQPHLGTQAGELNLAHAWQFAGGKGAGVKVLVLDVGFGGQHEDMPNVPVVVGQNKINAGQDHGLAVASIIGAINNETGNGNGFTGIAPDATLLYGGIGAELDSAAIIRAAADLLSPGDIINMSVQRGGPLFQAGQGELSSKGALPFEWWPGDYEAIRYATDKGIIVVSIAGNGDGSLDLAAYNTPASDFPSWWRNPLDRTKLDSGSVLVGSASPGNPRGANWGTIGSRLAFSNYGKSVDVSAWGREVAFLSYFNPPPNNPGSYYFTGGTGTSISAPIVVGALACVQGALKAVGRPPMLPAQARAALRATGYPQQVNTSERIGNMVNLKGLFDYFGLKLPKPIINSFVADDTSITTGQSVTLSWDVTGAANVSLNFGIGTIAGNSIVRTPSGTSTYILTATNEWGSVTQQVTVTVASPAAPVPPVIGEFYASPPQINLGQNTTLIWRTIGADRVRIDGAEVPGSSLLVGPDSTRQYQLSAEGPGGTVTRTLSVKVTTPAVVAGQAAQAHSGLNLGELVDKVYQVCGMDIAETARIEQLLNEAQDEISKLTMAPTKEVKLSMVSGSFQIPEAEYNGILEVHSYVPGNVNAGYPVRLLTTTEASRYFPNWRRSLEGGATGPEYADGAPMQYIIYDPVNVSAPLVPMPFKSSSQDIYVKLHLRPDRMVEYGDLPLNGELPNSHEALWQYVCFQLLNESGDERQTQRGMMAFSRYKALVDRMVSDARPEPVFPDRETASDYSWGELRFGGRGRNW